MTKEEAIKLLSQIMDALLASNSWLPSTDNPIKEAFGMAISALQAQESCNNLATDTISKQAVIDVLEKIDCSDGVGLSALKCEVIDDAVTNIKALSAAEPKKGKWIIATGMMPPEFHGHHCCSECGNFANMEPPFGNREDLSNFCPYCGADMRGKEYAGKIELSKLRRSN